METPSLYLLAADLILASHFVIVGFIVFGLLFTLIGKFALWSWVRNPWFRLIHLTAIAFVVLQSWFGRICPLTNWEMALRNKAGDAVYAGSFVAHWLNKVLYYQAPPWVFIALYTACGALVLVSWFWVPPRSFRRSTKKT